MKETCTDEGNNCYVVFTWISIDQLGYRVVVGGGGVGITPPALTPFYNRLLDRNLKTTWTVFPSHEGNTDEENNGSVIFYEISMDQLEIEWWWGREGGIASPTPTPFYSRLLGRYLKTTWTVFPPNEGNTEDENNYFDIFNWNIHLEIEWWWGREALPEHYSTHPHPFLQHASGKYLKTTWKVFPPSQIFASRWCLFKTRKQWGSDRNTTV